MPVASIARPIRPPSASISVTRCPLAVPPIAGLRGICAPVSGDSVNTAVRQPRRAAAQAASQPACPAPMTATSKDSMGSGREVDSLLPDAEAAEDVREHLFGRAPAGDLLERVSRELQVGEHAPCGRRA